jgi:hypothetical protein
MTTLFDHRLKDGVIVGRGGAYILDDEDVLKVFFVA